MSSRQISGPLRIYAGPGAINVYLQIVNVLRELLSHVEPAVYTLICSILGALGAGPLGAVAGSAAAALTYSLASDWRVRMSLGALVVALQLYENEEYIRDAVAQLRQLIEEVWGPIPFLT